MKSIAREKNAKLNIIVSLVCQMLTMICGLITPRYMLRAFGSEANGAITSITTFLGYIILLEGGIGGIARAALYKPLAEGNNQKISEVMSEIKVFFRRIGYVFALYVLVLACSFNYISHSNILDWITSFSLVIIISSSTFAQYFFGISNTILLSAAQKLYIINILSVVGTILNTIIVVILTNNGCSLITIKLVSSFVFAIKPFAMWYYVKKNFNVFTIKSHNKALKDKWTGLGQHIAFFLHTHTDIVVLTVFGNLKAVSVYAIYNMVTTAIQSITVSFSSGMEAVFGDMYAKNETKMLNRAFNIYETLISAVTVVLFGSTMILILPFVRLYTFDIKDTNYIEPTFAILLICACIIYCLRTPYHNMVIAAGRFKQTRVASYGEAIINIVTSIILVIKYGLVGVAIGTVLASLFRFVFYAIYLSEHVLRRGIIFWFKREVINIINIVVIYFIGKMIINKLTFTSYFIWIEAGFVVGAIAIIITLVVNFLCYPEECKELVQRVKFKRKNIKL